MPSKAMRRVLEYIVQTGGWLADDPFCASSNTLNALAARGWVRLHMGLAGQVLAAEPTKLGCAVIAWGEARVYVRAA